MRKSAGILLYRLRNNLPEFFLVHPGGPFWAKKDAGAWSIPKGEFTDEEDPLAAARRELEEETGIKASGDFIQLTPSKQKSGKMVFAWALQNEADASQIQSNTFEMEWPPKSGKMKSFAEVDKASWFNATEAKEKIVSGQVAFIAQLEEILRSA